MAAVVGPNGKRRFTYAEIGLSVGLTRQRVHAILKAAEAA